MFHARMFKSLVGLVLAFAWLTGPASTNAAADEALAQEASWSAPSLTVLRGQVLSLAEEQEAAPEVLERLAALWDQALATNAESANRLQLVLQSAEILHPELAPWVRQLQVAQSPFRVPDLSPLADESLAGWFRQQFQFAVGIWMTQNRLFDEAIDQLSPLSTDDVVDPASLLFYRGVAYQRVIQKQPALADLERLLEREDELPRRFRDLARLMVADLEPLESDSLNEIARMMDDIHRRQSLYRSGKRVREEEDEVIKKLDKLIEELEQQQQQMQMAASNMPSSPANESRLKGGPAPGEVDQKPQGSGADWGDLPEKERAAAMAELAKDLPSHYRELIEEYYRKLAEDPNAQDR